MMRPALRPVQEGVEVPLLSEGAGAGGGESYAERKS
jgi:hypothetical protein